VIPVNQIRLCIFSYYFPPHFSGAGLYALTLGKELTRRGIQVFFVTVDNTGLPAQDTYQGFEVYRIPDGPRKHGEFVLWWNLWRRLRKLKSRFDILHASGSTYRNSAVGPIARLLGKRSLTVVSMAHNDLYPIGRTSVGRLQAFFLGFVDRYVSLSSEITKEIGTLPLDARRAVEIPQGVNLERFAPAEAATKAALRSKLDLPERPLALYVGVFDGRKNVEWLVKTWAKFRAQFPEWCLLLVGPKSRDLQDSGLKDALRTFIQEQGLADEILFRDFTPQVEDFYRVADLFVLPSHNEGMPNVVLEAMASGVPCVVTRISGTTDLIAHGVTGMLFDVNDERSLLDALNPLTRDGGLRNDIGERARERIRERYSSARVADRYIQLYQEILDRK
jgi:glycosyltransferase involved in cell wall biosynthesis